MSDRVFWTEAQIELVEQARDAAQIAARRVQDAEVRVVEHEGDVQGLKEDVQTIGNEIATRQQQIEAVIAANIPGHEWDLTSLRLMNPDGGWGNYVDLKGETGPAPTLQIGTVETLAAGQPATVTIGGSGGTYSVSFGIPSGADAAALQLAIGTVTTLPAGQPASATITGDYPNLVLNLELPQGADGDDGTNGTNGTNGTDGVSVTGASINGEGELVLTLSDASTANAGPLPMPSSDASSADIIRLAIDVATLKGDIVMLASGLVDGFENEDGVDLVSSVDEQYDAVNLLYHNDDDTVSIEDTLPAMTGASAPAGHVATASSSQSGTFPWTVFDKDDGTSWLASSATLPQWVRRQTPDPVTVAEYKVRSTGSRGPADFTLQGSNNGADWTTLDTQSSVPWSGTETKTFTVPELNRAAFTYHRLHVTALIGAIALAINELELREEVVAGPQVMDLRSVAWSALSAPATGRVTIAAKGVGGTITPDTDLVAYVSRDDGTTWTQANLTAAETTAAGFTFYSGDADISGQPSGTDMKWRVVTSDAFEVQVGTVALSWE